MSLSPKWADELKTNGIDARHWSEIGPANAPDVDIFAFAKVENVVILTADVDFGTLLAVAKSKQPSVVQLRLPRISLEKAFKPALQALIQFREQIENGALVTIDVVKVRVRILPFQ